jgi:hypothetical protein
MTRRNRYHLNSDVKMRHVAQADLDVGELLDAFSCRRRIIRDGYAPSCGGR